MATEKRYQVFISSTFADLKEERGKVQQAIMEMDCIPAGMELFPAIDEDQFEFIKKVIDDCDYYLLIIGGRYGSLSNEGVSYTELEYKYAVSKGLRIIAFLHKDPESIPAGKTELDAKARRKLAAFRDEASTGRLVRYWTEASELPGLTLVSLTQAIRRYPAVGWVRGDQVADPNLYKELADLRKENQELRESNSTQAKNPNSTYNLAGLDEEVIISGGASITTKAATTTKPAEIESSAWKAEITWGELFGIIAPTLYTPSSDTDIRRSIAYKIFDKSNLRGKQAANVGISFDDFQTMKIQYKALGFIELRSNGSETVWSLTELGEQELINLRAIKKATSPALPVVD